jgi:hypothetical protein
MGQQAKIHILFSLFAHGKAPFFVSWNIIAQKGAFVDTRSIPADIFLLRLLLSPV